MVDFNFCTVCGIRLMSNNRVDIPDFEMLCHSCYTYTKPKTVCIDFDGVLSEYSGWKGPDTCGDPTPGSVEFLTDLHLLNYRVVILSTRDPEIIKAWLNQHVLSHLIYDVTNVKIPAIAYIDDRNIIYRGNFSDVLTDLKNFKPHWKE